MADLAVVGHIAIDRVIDSGGCRRQLGGSPAYVSLVARRLGLDAGAVTKVGGDMPAPLLDQLRGLGIDLRGQVVEDAETTRFTLDYRWAERRLSVESVCEAIGPEDVRGLPSAVLISPILGEVPPETAHAISADLVALDPQGLVREVRRGGSIGPKPWFDVGLLRRVDIYKSSERELRLVAGEDDPWRGLGRVLGLGPEAAVATRGAEGALLMTGGDRYFVPAYAPAEVVDPTGAGDAFMGGFLSEYLRGGEGPWCAAVGSAAASCVVETAGVSMEASAGELRRRAEEIYDGAVRL
ncbi:hypothetical protein AC482_07445 [miscellaneous Crenarchaeota group-15 archaeon DG-45]|uniref:Carbohydrate kinase PfkB domain-containing protein n=1 Tax=miscellaneous Crenarchaeota group-15 archaeon DG-45 TaxID=1685127 RepID=A0A0M0BK80_9ARCH|nr:MAG: hypothetical protein AC482_07445 [miscellaneous Crenarchaeota group-15 archaeon DG-45]